MADTDEWRSGIGAWRHQGLRIIAFHASTPVIRLRDDQARKLVQLLVSALSQPVTAQIDRKPKDWREAAGFTQEEAAHAVGISRTYMSKIERGKAKNLTLATARKIAALYACDVSELNIDL